MKRIKLANLPSLVGVVLLSTIIFDIIRILSYDSFPIDPESEIHCEQDGIYYDLVNGNVDIDWSRLDGTLEYIHRQYDCSDFRLVNLIRILYEFEEYIPDSTLECIQNTLFDFRYWWDEPGENSMCYWTENHQILFASAEYLIGQKYPDVVFGNSGLTGREHKQKARRRALDWLQMRWTYGFSEHYSGVYYKEDIAAMINLIDFADDEELVEKTKIIMDLLFYDVATQSINTMFVSASNRAYTHNRIGGPGAALGGLTRYFWGDGKEIGPGMMYGMMTSSNYTLPPVLKEIAGDTATVILRNSNGLDILELGSEGFGGEDTKSMMMQLAIGGFSNPEVVRNSLAFVRKNRMFSNGFLTDFKLLDFTLLKVLHLEPLLVRLINPQSNGVAMQRANVYTYKSKAYSLYSTQNYFPGTYGDQHHVAGMNINNDFSVFHTHPAVEKDVHKQSPNYWVGYGHLPHVAQDRNVSQAIYNLPDKKGLMEADLLSYTHAYFPTEKFDSVCVADRYALGKKGDTYCALVGKNELFLRANTTDDLHQTGKQTFWIFEAGSKFEDRSFESFCNRVRNNPVTFDSVNLELTYQSRGITHKLQFGGDFMLNGDVVNVEYDRYDSPYSSTPRKPDSITYQFNGQFLHLDFDDGTRVF